MAESKSYPQIPTAIWWGFRQMLTSKPSLQLTPRTLAVHFEVQETAAKAYFGEIQKTKLIDEEGKATDLARSWRVDATYKGAVKEILKNAYPDELIDTLGTEQIDRGKAKQWFMLDGLGAGTANNKAATLALISSSIPGETPPTVHSSKNNNTIAAKKPPTPKKPQGGEPENPKRKPDAEFGPLNINIQIHISADSSPDQIETIFSAMKKYLRDD